MYNIFLCWTPILSSIAYQFTKTISILVINCCGINNIKFVVLNETYLIFHIFNWQESRYSLAGLYGPVSMMRLQTRYWSRLGVSFASLPEEGASSYWLATHNICCNQTFLTALLKLHSPFNISLVNNTFLNINYILKENVIRLFH